MDSELKLGECLADVIKRPFPGVMAETPIVVAGGFLRCHNVDALFVLRRGTWTNEGIFGFPVISELMNTNDYNSSIWKECGSISTAIPHVSVGQNLVGLLALFEQRRFGNASIYLDGQPALISLSDIIRLYSAGTLDTDLKCADVMSKMFSLPPDATIGEALKEMVKRRIRRIFLEDGNTFISDRTVIRYLFSPEGLHLSRESPSRTFEAKISETDPEHATAVDGNTGIREAAGLVDVAAGSCLTCGGGVVTPWDLVIKPFQKQRLVSR